MLLRPEWHEAASPVGRAAPSAAAAMLTAAESVQARLELILDEKVGPLAPDQLAFLQVAARDGKRLLGLIEELQLIALVDSDQLAPEVELFDLGELVEEVANRLLPRVLAAGKQIDVVHDGTSWIEADEKRVGLALGKLLAHVLTLAPWGSTIGVRVEGSGVEVRYEGPELPRDDALPIALAEAVARLHGGSFSVGASFGAVVLSLALTDRTPVLKLVPAA
jgi:signal transduction histidine kinase